ncbi:zinc transporter ZIP11 isoform 4-T5 [Spheniscus humboldti]
MRAQWRCYCTVSRQLFWPDLRKKTKSLILHSAFSLHCPSRYLKSAKCEASPAATETSAFSIHPMFVPRKNCLKSLRCPGCHGVAVARAFIEHLLLSIKGETLVFCHLNMARCEVLLTSLLSQDKGENGEPYQRRKGAGASLPDGPPAFPTARDSAPTAGSSSWRRIMLMILAITIHNIPEGLAVGVGFGAIGKSASATFQSARNLAIGIGIQNFPEGLAVSLPLRGAGFSTWKAFWYGQLSGMVEPLAGIFGAFAVVVAEPLLPYALGFAAGAMVYVVMDDIIPEAQTSGNGKLASWTSILGFVVMMSLDVGLG